MKKKTVKYVDNWTYFI